MTDKLHEIEGLWQLLERLTKEQAEAEAKLDRIEEAREKDVDAGIAAMRSALREHGFPENKIAVYTESARRKLREVRERCGR